jgi:uncharacterized membrane protein YhhN
VTPFAVATLVFVALLLAAEARESARLRHVAKPLASLGFVAAAWAGGALETPYGRSVLLALGLGALGDVLLLPRASATFLGGLVAFLLGHLAFARAFTVRGASLVAALGAALFVAPAAVLAWRWLAPHLPPKMRLPVRAYVAVISTMVIAAAAAVGQPRWPAILLGALLFYASDLAVARQRFVTPALANKLWGLPLYYGAQLVLAWTAARPTA